MLISLTRNSCYLDKMSSWRSSVPFLVYFVVFLSINMSEAREILVGGTQNSWKIPESVNQTLNHWAERTRFKVGDSLVWNYDAKRDSVMQVTLEAYESCERSNPIKVYKDGNTKIKLDKSGPFYFISGEEGRCQMGEKLIVVVLSPNHWKTTVDGGAAAAPATNSGGGRSAGGGWMRVWAMGFFGLVIVSVLA